MMPWPHITSDRFVRERMLVVGDPPLARGPRVMESLRACYPAWDISRCDSYLAAIADVARNPASAVLANVDPALTQLDNAVAGLRQAAGGDTKLVLCCRPPELDQA